MTFELLNKIIDKYNIPHNVHFMSDSEWECNATEMNGIWYNRKENILIFTQGLKGECATDYGKGYKKLSIKNLEGDK